MVHSSPPPPLSVFLFLQVSVTYTVAIAGPYNLSSVLGNVVGSVIQLSSALVDGTIPIKYDCVIYVWFLWVIADPPSPVV